MSSCLRFHTIVAMDAPNSENHFSDASDDFPEIELEIDTGRRRRWVNWVLYVLVFALLSGVLVWFFVMLNTALALAIAVVVFMVGSMVIMGYVAGKGYDERRNSF